MTLCLFLLVMSLHELFCLRNAATEVNAGTVLLASAIMLLPPDAGCTGSGRVLDGRNGNHAAHPG